ncbi:MAG: hypothetical protein HY062_04510 [Bacteroidetes bacterium]|nr:hypothetical protein [Bacteroidota bacterium]
MDILQDLIKSLEKEEIKSYKLYAKITHNFDVRKDIELFDSIKKQSHEPDIYHFKALYKGSKPDTKYYRLKNKIADDIGMILSNLNHKKPETDILHLVGLAKIFIRKHQYHLAVHYLKLAERRAIDKEEYAMLEAIYEQMVRLSIQNMEENPAKIIERRNENSQRLKLLQDLENNLAILSHEVKTTQNLTTKKDITTWLHHTLKNTIKLSYVKNSSQLRIRIFQNVSRLMLLLKDYTSLEAYLKSCLLEFERDHVFTKQTHEIKLQLLVYLCNASYMLNNHTQSIHYAGVLHKAIFEFDKVLYDQYIFYYYNILVNNYSKTNLSKAIDTLEAAQNEKQIKNNPHQYFYVLNNLAILNFDLKKYKQASKFFSQMYVSQNFKSLDISFVVKLHVFELINRIELEDYEQCDKQWHHLYKLIDDMKEKESIKIDLAMLGLIRQFLDTPQNRWRPLKSGIQAFIKKFSTSEEGAGLINYAQWLESKV